MLVGDQVRSVMEVERHVVDGPPPEAGDGVLRVEHDDGPVGIHRRRMDEAAPRFDGGALGEPGALSSQWGPAGGGVGGLRRWSCCWGG